EELHRHDPRQGVPSARGHANPPSEKGPSTPEIRDGLSRLLDPGRPRRLILPPSRPTAEHRRRAGGKGPGRTGPGDREHDPPVSTGPAHPPERPPAPTGRVRGTRSRRTHG